MTKDRFITQHPLPKGRVREILEILHEECNEVGQRISKAQRFGLDEIQEGQSLTNAERIAIEVGDLHEMLYMAVNEDIIDLTYIEIGQVNKRRQLKKYMQHQNCEHDWVTDPNNSLIDICTKCKEERA